MDGGIEEIWICVHCQKNDLRRHPQLLNFASNCESIQLRHINIEDGDIGRETPNELEGHLSVTGFGDNLNSIVLFNARPKALANDGVVISKKDSNLFVHDHLPR